MIMSNIDISDYTSLVEVSYADSPTKAITNH